MKNHIFKTLTYTFALSNQTFGSVWVVGATLLVTGASFGKLRIITKKKHSLQLKRILKYGYVLIIRQNVNKWWVLDKKNHALYCTININPITTFIHTHLLTEPQMTVINPRRPSSNICLPGVPSAVYHCTISSSLTPEGPFFPLKRMVHCPKNNLYSSECNGICSAFVYLTPNPDKYPCVWSSLGRLGLFVFIFGTVYSCTQYTAGWGVTRGDPSTDFLLRPTRQTRHTFYIIGVRGAPRGLLGPYTQYHVAIGVYCRPYTGTQVPCSTRGTVGLTQVPCSTRGTVGLTQVL